MIPLTGSLVERDLGLDTWKGSTVVELEGLDMVWLVFDGILGSFPGSVRDDKFTAKISSSFVSFQPPKGLLTVAPPTGLFIVKDLKKFRLGHCHSPSPNDRPDICRNIVGSEVCFDLRLPGIGTCIKDRYWKHKWIAGVVECSHQDHLRFLPHLTAVLRRVQVPAKTLLTDVADFYPAE